jgi:hypothetical protein
MPEFKPGSELKHLLDRALDDLPAGPADPSADLRRGRSRLRRSRIAAGAAPTAMATALAGVWIAGSLPGQRRDPGMAVRTPVATSAADPSATSPAARSATSPPASSATTRVAVDLVAFTGHQVPGYRVKEVPSGWTIQGGNPTVLVLAPIGFPDQDVNVFFGKLIVAQNAPGNEVTEGRRVDVGGRPGYFRTEDDTQLLDFTTADGKHITVQAPVSLGWDAAHLSRFAAGVQVLAQAQPGQG